MADLFDIGFETGDLSEYATTAIDGGKLSVAAGAALIGSYGVQALIDNTNQKSAYNIITKVPVIRLRFYFDPNSIVMANNDRFVIHRIIQSAGGFGAIVRVSLDYTTANGYRLLFDGVDDAGTLILHSFKVISDSPHYIEYQAVRSTDALSNNGSYQWWVDGVDSGSVANVDNYNRMFDQNWRAYGPYYESVTKTGTGGTVYWDAFKANDDGGLIGAVASGTLIPIFMSQYRQRAA